jgi:hypothetical protein
MPLPDYTKDAEFDLPIMSVSINTVNNNVGGDSSPIVAEYNVFEITGEANVTCCETDKSVTVMKVREGLLIPCFARLLPLVGLDERGEVTDREAFIYFIETLDNDFEHWGEFAHSIPTIAAACGDREYPRRFDQSGAPEIPLVYVGDWNAPGRPGRKFGGISVSEHVLLNWIAQHGGRAIIALSVRLHGRRLVTHWASIFNKAHKKGLFSSVIIFNSKDNNEGMHMIVGLP